MYSVASCVNYRYKDIFKRYINYTVRVVNICVLLGSLSNENDGYENVTKKVNSRCPKLSRASSISFN